jgi:hypothetical protein
MVVYVFVLFAAWNVLCNLRHDDDGIKYKRQSGVIKSKCEKSRQNCNNNSICVPDTFS